MDLEHELTRLLEDSVDGMAVPVHTIVAEATVRGRRFRIRRRLQTAAAALSVAALVGTGAVIGLPHRPPAAPTAPAVSAPMPSAMPTTSATPTTSDRIAKILSDLLPPGTSLRQYSKVTVSAHTITFDVEYDDGQGGPVAVWVTLESRRPTGEAPDCENALEAGDIDRLSCKDAVTTDGTDVVVKRTMSGAGVIAFECSFHPRDGVVVVITASNGTIDNPTEPGQRMTATRAVPPLTPSAWSTVAESPRWQLLAQQEHLTPEP
ncbi:hypothetical protein GCM10010193_64490 [Kitasatospora atroaurantiaca]|uniref:Uncharacterized protein n=1 Tax=Kitasatospora atroaurantiaca TaxID=285545 RepID=A0A561EM99_9ACTN|nr:hypothetical protein [Kitasatospora atroaurantiaca]TWE16751.1 hypothetical protein FB465_1741 [Kitasatospora atroaurantiaca]